MILKFRIGSKNYLNNIKISNFEILMLNITDLSNSNLSGESTATSKT